MQLVDHIFIVLLFVVQPIYGYFENRRYEARDKAGEALDRIRFYRLQSAEEWAFFLALAIAWWFYGRPWADLGFSKPGGPGFWGGIGVLVLMAGFLLYSWHDLTKASESERATHREGLGSLAKYLPQTAPELRSFVGVSITAGIVEEIVYRGFVIWYLGHFMPLWAAVIVSAMVFGLAHGYQGASGVLRVSLIGLAFGVYYVVTGSIWLPILAHVLLDALQGAAIHEIFKQGDQVPEPEAA